MVCNPNDLNLNFVPLPGTVIPGFGIPFSPVQFPPLPDFQWPEGFPENILDFINQLGTIFPPGSKFEPNLDDLTNSLLKAIASILNQIAPFLALYRFFQALLNMVMCILEVLCSIQNPVKMQKAMVRLFKHCLPPFLNLLPWLALIAMIIALLLLLLALIEYIINRILALINEIIKNITILAEGATLQNEDAILAATEKIAQLLCLMENLIAVFAAVAAIISIIEALAGIQGRTVCGSGSNVFGDNVDCCGDDVCPPFIRNNPDGIVGTNGLLIYHKQIDVDTITLFGGLSPSLLNLSPLRTESWQFVNEDLNQLYEFLDIITPVGEDNNIFFPEQEYNKNTLPQKVPYTVDLTLQNFDPVVFHPSDTQGARNFNITGCILSKKPTVGVLNYQNVLDTSINDSGTFFLVGGAVTEEDGTPYIISGATATLETFIHETPTITSSGLPSTEDGYFMYSLDYTWKINHPVLLGLSLITLGCLPEVALEREAVNITASPFDSVLNRIGSLPDVAGTQICASQAIQKFRQNVSIDNAANFQSEILGCINNLKTQTLDTLTKLIIAGVSPYTSTVEVEPSLLFTTQTALVTVVLKDAGGNSLINNLPSDVANDVGAKLSATASLGQLSSFSYDGYGAYTATLSSDTAGTGLITASFDGNTFQTVTITDTASTSFQDNQPPYTFVASILPEVGPAVRRDESDVSRDGGSL